MIIARKNFFTTPVLLSLLFAIIYSLVSLPNHYFFRTATLDLGLYTNALFDYAHLKLADTSPFKEHSAILLSDHFDPILILFSPLSWLFKSWTLLLVQILALVFGGQGVYRFLMERFSNRNISITGMLVFYLHYSMFSALSFDYHSNVIAASMVPWFFLFLQKEEAKRFWLFFILILICKENMALWLFFICLGSMFLFHKTTVKKQLFLMATISLFYFFTITAWLMPLLSNEQAYVQFKYSVLGSNFKEAFATIISEPVKIFKTLFINHSGRHFGDYTKAESWIFFLVSGGVFLLYRPIWLFMLIPIFLQKYLHNNISMWGVNDQYSIEFAPIIACGGMDAVSKIERKKIQKIASIGLLILTCAITIRLMDRTSARVPKTNVRLYQSAHWKSDLPLADIREMLSLIPEQAGVSSHSIIHPHVAWRDKAYMFPMLKDADYVCFIRKANPYPLSMEEFLVLADKIETSPDVWELIFSKNDLRLFKRVNAVR
ncbi:MAG TPA: DUF2079 domain-containing protein [Bacteroidia bacterium]|nr:DUF2079 domain-containing protein [Bacteroidia bacterium]